MFTFTKAQAEQFFEIKHFLKRHKTYAAGRHDFIFTLRLDGAADKPAKNTPSLIGLARLLEIEDGDNTLWLRGLFIDPNFRQQGLASRLLAEMATFLNHHQKQYPIKRLYAFSAPHLKDFYLKNGYQLIMQPQLPESLQKRYQQAVQANKNWLCWQYDLN